jgi:UDP-N-acetylglucosamine/UDP-N-acetyl-alpha-D-glucosaminouronate 4-epimerase
MAPVMTPPASAGDALEQARHAIRARPRTWLVTGSAGFIGSHLLEELLRLGQHVVSIDNFATGHRRNLDEVRLAVGERAWSRHRFVEADIADLAACRSCCVGVEIVLHEAALGSVPRSIEDPLATHASNNTGFLNMLVAAREASVARFIYAGSSSTYGDSPLLPKVEPEIGVPLSPYAVTKYVDELYARVFFRCYGTQTIGFRYFNVFGPRQDPDGAYAAVIPRWTDAVLAGTPVVINGDGETTRDFCYVANVVQANLLAATTENSEAMGEVFNVAVGGRLSLNALDRVLREILQELGERSDIAPVVHRPFRRGDVRHSQADISKATRMLGYCPTHDTRSGLREAMPWYIARASEGKLAQTMEATNARGGR